MQKSAAVYTNDPEQPQFNLLLKAMVKPFIQVKPSSLILFRGLPDQLRPQAIELITNSEPFHIMSVDTSLKQQITIERVTVEDGKHYRIQLSNAAPGGNYSGYVMIRTDHPKRPEIRLTVTGAIESELRVSPLALLIGHIAPDQSYRTGDIMVRRHSKQPFRIVHLSYDEKLITVRQEPSPDGDGYVLRVTPLMEDVPKGEHRQTNLSIETDVKGGAKDQVRVNVVND